METKDVGHETRGGDAKDTNCFYIVFSVSVKSGKTKYKLEKQNG